MAKEEKEYKYNLGDYEPVYKTFITNLLDEYNIEYRELYKSKYNEYVVYEYEPSFTVGFYYSVDIEGNPDVINFIDYLIKQHIKNIEKLNKLIKETKEDK